MTGPDSKFEEEIRRALCAASDLVVPAGDGLNKIRERAARRRHILGWLLAYATHLPHQLAHGTQVAASEVAATSRGYSSLRPMLRSVRRWPGGALHMLQSPDKWLRPVLASAATLFIVIGAMLAVPRLRHSMEATLSGAFTSSPGQHHGRPGGGAAPGGAQSATATGLGGGTGSGTPGMPYLATLLPTTTRCPGQGGSGTSGSSGETYPPPSLAPGPSQTVGAGAFGTETTTPLGTVGLKVARLGAAGPQPDRTCSPSTSPTHRATASPTPPPVSTPPTSPPPVSTPPTSTPPVSTPPTSPPPTSPPPTSTPPTQGTPGGSNSATAGSPAS